LERFAHVPSVAPALPGCTLAGRRGQAGRICQIKIPLSTTDDAKVDANQRSHHHVTRGLPPPLSHGVGTFQEQQAARMQAHNPLLSCSMQRVPIQ
jgi:hypothetical protein